ncbi:histone deacetylase family protein, partial [bacterium]|nr:histone deacetylase family protein [candidate division CSSED10-310 bacterium]
FLAAKRAVDCALTAADKLLEGYRIAYALVRPPGHHAERNVYGGFCYFNNAAVAANYLSSFGKIAILDIDYHHGNGQQDIFYSRNDVLTVSIHGEPSTSYPYFTGFISEKGEGSGLGFNINLPLHEHITNDEYMTTLEKAIRNIQSFGPSYIIVCLGLDTARGDPTGSWNLNTSAYKRIGSMIGNLKQPVLVIQEGGYLTRSIGANAKHFFLGLWNTKYKTIAQVSR